MTNSTSNFSQTQLLSILDNTTAGEMDDLYCGHMDEHFAENWMKCQYWCEGVLFSTIGAIGLLGNLISIFVLATKEMRKHSFNHLLVILSCFDLAFIVCGVPVHVAPVFGIEGWLYAKLYQYIFYPLTSVSFTGSIYMTLAITIERYIAVCKPHRYRELNIRMNAFKRVLIYTIPVASFSVLLNIPKFFETQVSYSNETGMVYDVSEHRLTPNYIWWYTLSFLFHPTLTLTVIPILTLLFFNYQIYKGIRKARTNVQSSNRHGEMNLAVVLVSICSVFIMCHALRLYLGLQAVFLINTTFSCMKHKTYWIPEYWLLCLESASHLLVMISSSTNFIIYCTISTKFKIFIKKRFFYRSRPHSSCNNEQTFNSQSQLRTLGPVMNGLNMRRPSGCQEIFRMAIQQAHTPPIPRPPEISINELNGHVRFTKQDQYLTANCNYLSANEDVLQSCQTLDTSMGTKDVCERSMKIDKSFVDVDEDNRQSDIELLSEDIFQDERLMIEDQKGSLFDDNLISTESNDNGHLQTMKEMDFLMPTANVRRHGRNSWTPEYALSDSKYAVRYRSTGNIFNLREYGTVDIEVTEKKPKSQDNVSITVCRKCSIMNKDTTSSMSKDENLTLQVPMIMQTSADDNCKISSCVDSLTELNGNERNPYTITSEKNVGTRSLSVSLNDKKHHLKLNGTSVPQLKLFNLPRLLTLGKSMPRKRHSIPRKQSKRQNKKHNNREIRSECSNRNAIENEEVTNETTVSSIEDKSCHLISLVSKMETSFDSSGPQKIGCCGVSSSNKSMISENVCPKNDAEGEIGHLPGQKWPHVICRQNSRIHCHVKKVDQLLLNENNSRRNSTALCGRDLTSRRSTNSTTATLSSLTPPSSHIQETSSDDEYHTSTSNDMSHHRDGNIHSETNQQAETYQANWNNLWFNEEVQI